MKYAELYSVSNEKYDHAFFTGRDKSARNLWINRKRQIGRFIEIVRFIDSSDRSILDVGCGNGMFLGFLKQKGFSGKYTGIDINHNLLSEAQADFPEADFRKLDILAETIEPFDCVVTSGLFNLNIGQDIDYVFEFLKRLYSISSAKVVFNALTTRDKQASGDLFFIDPCVLIPFIIERLSSKFELRHSFLSSNYTICIHRTERSPGLPTGA